MNPKHTITYWRNQLQRDPMVRQVIRSWPFQRLAGVSFLGAIDYLPQSRRLHRRHRTRAAHSCDVAALANYVAYRRGYAKDVRRHVVIAALLHDIGHAPLSHSVEPFFRAELGVGHHELGEMLLAGAFPRAKRLAALLGNETDTSLIRQLIAGKAPHDYGGDLFASPINIDTIDGIWRTWRTFSGIPAHAERLAVTEASFLRDDDARYELLDCFWEMKGAVYSRFINGGAGILADQCSRDYFEATNHAFTEASLVTTERTWRRRYAGLFEGLKNLMSTRGKGEAPGRRSITYTSREYRIDRDSTGLARYSVIKTPAVCAA